MKDIIDNKEIIAKFTSDLVKKETDANELKDKIKKLDSDAEFYRKKYQEEKDKICLIF
jgi:hypothetical protein